MKLIGILGATSHIAKNLILNFLEKDNDIQLFLFVRNQDKLNAFLNETVSASHLKRCFQLPFSELNSTKIDVLINCVGIGNPSELISKPYLILSLTEEFDNLCINYVSEHTKTLLINFSSGAAYGKDFSKPVGINSKLEAKINFLENDDFYGIAKLNSEAKHRAFKNFNIADLRIFGFFSRFIDLSAGFLMSEIINAIESKNILTTNSKDICRDFIDPQDLTNLIFKIIEKSKTAQVNGAYDVRSLKPVKKFEILNFFAENFGLQYKIIDTDKISTATGFKDNYYSINNDNSLIKFYPTKTSIETLKNESKYILQRKSRTLK